MATTRPPRKLRFVNREDPKPNSVDAVESEIGVGVKNLNWVLLKETSAAVFTGGIT